MISLAKPELCPRSRNLALQHPLGETELMKKLAATRLYRVVSPIYRGEPQYF
ncbi:hypothetical protein HDE80_001542 [Rhodanobacter sp. A1T4]|nr:hypothetical protein [Rhodanobacter sp. A1T4]